ncbi:5-oxoprolinase subunit PxpB [Hymenobacter glacialis]|uniref:Kinase inhibitor n=1 Tax=Hymenobacter glacialis TaxID=1908236 RepID=A0A1G1T477_9BACT|nr:5-oxoprolinase subunit PxpB [Hymenobacter glacialis]OGX85678.1 kinase inhibitor [Hymenobacter glacialis]
MSTDPTVTAASPVRLYALGDAAIVLEFGGGISAATHAAIAAFSARLARQPCVGLREVVPAFTTLTVYYDPWLASENGRYAPHDRVADQLRALLAVPAAAQAATETETVDIPVCYGGAFGPDLDFVARHTKLSLDEVIARHSAPDYLVHMIGFAPGFPYLGGMDAQLATSRKAQPRPLVPAGAVGIAGPQTGIYSLPTPGGWQLIGRTPLRLFNPAWAQPSRLQAGQRLRFVPISAAEFRRLQQHES